MGRRIIPAAGVFVLLFLLGAAPAVLPVTRPAARPASQPSGGSVADLTGRVEAAKAKVAQATDRIAQLKAAAGTKAESSPAVKAAVADIAAKQKALDKARLTGTPQEKLDAGSAYNKARLGLDKVKADAAAAALAATDREVKPAEGQLKAAQDELKAAETELAAAKGTQEAADAAIDAVALKSNRLVTVGGGQMFIHIESPVVYLPAGGKRDQFDFVRIMFRDTAKHLSTVKNAAGSTVKVGQEDVPVTIKSDDEKVLSLEDMGMFGVKFIFRDPGEVNLVVSMKGTDVKVPLQVVRLPYSVNQPVADVIAKYGPPASSEKVSVTYPLYKNIDSIAYTPGPGGSMEAEHMRFKGLPYAVFAVGADGTIFKIGSHDPKDADAIGTWINAGKPAGPATQPQRGNTGRGGATPQRGSATPGRGGRRGG